MASSRSVLRLHGGLGVPERRVLRVDGVLLCSGEVVADRVREDEVAVREALHQRARAEAVRAVVREVRLARDVEARDRGHQVVVHPEPAHRVVRGRVDAHRDLVGVVVRDALVHVEEVAVALADDVLAEAADRVREVEVDAEARLADAAALVADLLGGARGDVARREVAERRVLPLEVVVALGLGDLAGGAFVALLERDPDAAVVAERLGHEGQLGLVVARDRDARRVDLRVAGVPERGALLVGAPDRRGVAALRVGREVEDVAVAARREDDGVGDVGLDGARHHVARHDAAGAPVDHDELEHLVRGVHLHLAEADLPLEGLVGAEEELLPRLAPRVEGARDLRAAEGAVREEAAVLARERDALRDALVDDVHGDLREPVDVRLARAEVAALDRVVEEAPDAVAVVLVVLGAVDAALRGDGVGAARAVLVAEAGDVVAELGEGRGARAAREARPDDDHGVLPLVRRVDEFHVEAVLVPLVLERAVRDVGLQFDHFSTPAITAIGTRTKPPVTRMVKTTAKAVRAFMYFGCERPRVWSIDHAPCQRWNARHPIATT